MSHRLKNSDFRPFLGVLDGKVRDAGVYAGEGTGIYFGVFSAGKSIPGRVGEYGKASRNYLLTDKKVI